VTHNSVIYHKILLELGKAVPERKKYLPKHTLPNGLVFLYTKLFMEAGVNNYVKATLGKQPNFDMSLTEKELGLKLIPWDQTIRDCGLFMKEAGYLKKKKM